MNLHSPDTAGNLKDKYNVLYIDDGKKYVEFMRKIFSHEAIDVFVKQTPDLLTETPVALLKKVELVGVHHDPSNTELERDQHAPNRHDTSVDEQLTPMSKEIRKIYNGEYDAIITDMNMPPSSADLKGKYGSAGGLLMANVARLANVPLLVHSLSGEKEIKTDIRNTSAFGAPSERHIAFSESVLVPGKENQANIYKMLASVLEKQQEQGRSVA